MTSAIAIRHESLSDIWHHLPSDTIMNIFSRMPIKSVTRTSLLSKEWKDKWLSFPRYIFDVKDLHADLLASVVNNILSKSRGKIYRFELHGLCAIDDYFIDPWIIQLSVKGINHISLCLKKRFGELYLLNSGLFAVQTLRSLKLGAVEIRWAPTFDGFSYLTRLHLFNSAMTNDVFESIMAKCPLLRSLCLAKCPLLRSLCLPNTLEVLPPKLERLLFFGGLRNLCLNSEALLDMTLFIIEDYPIPVNLARKRLHDSKLWLSQTRALRGDSNLLKFLGLGSAQFAFMNLRTLKLDDFPFGCLDYVSPLVCLIRSSPYLKHLLILASTFESEGSTQPAIQYIEREQCKLDVFSNLEHVEILRTRGAEADMNFIKLILTKSPCLQTLTVEPDRNSNLGEVMGISSYLEGLCPSSQSVKMAVLINYYESFEDRIKQFML